MSIRLSVIAFSFIVATLPAQATPRSAKVRSDFQHANPCPSTGHTRGPCTGYVKDHIRPLCAGGVDHPSNMQWQTVPDAKAKDKWERKECGK